MDTKKVIGSRINEALAFSNKKQKELAAHLGVPDNTISYFCSGKRVPNAEQIIEISKFLGVSADFLLGLSGNKTTEPKLQSACEYTGLNENAVENIKETCYILSSNKEFIKIFNWLLSETYIGDIAFQLMLISQYSDYLIRLKKSFYEMYPHGFSENENISVESNAEYLKYINLSTTINDEDMQCNVSRYNVIKIAEKLSNNFDKRENSTEYEKYNEIDLKTLLIKYEKKIKEMEAEQNGKHNPPKE